MPIQLASDNFTRANSNPISGNWATVASLTGDNNGLQIVSNAVEAASPAGGHGGAAEYTGVSWPADQYSEITIGTLSDPNDYICPVIRMSAGTFYLLNAAAGANPQIQKVVGGAGTVLFTSSVTVTTGDVIRISIVGITLTAFKNGVSIGSVTDSSISSGNAGIFTYTTVADANATATLWAGGTNVVPPPPSGKSVVVAIMG